MSAESVANLVGLFLFGSLAVGMLALFPFYFSLLRMAITGKLERDDIGCFSWVERAVGAFFAVQGIGIWLVTLRPVIEATRALWESARSGTL